MTGWGRWRSGLWGLSSTPCGSFKKKWTDKNIEETWVKKWQLIFSLVLIVSVLCQNMPIYAICIFYSIRTTVLKIINADQFYVGTPPPLSYFRGWANVGKFAAVHFRPYSNSFTKMKIMLQMLKSLQIFISDLASCFNKYSSINLTYYVFMYYVCSFLPTDPQKTFP